MVHIKHLVTIFAPADKLYSAITEPQELSKWWTKRTGKEGNVLSFQFTNEPEPTLMKIIKESKDQIVWECTEGPKDWVGTTVTFNLQDRDDRTTLRFCHDSWKEENDFCNECNFWWGYFLNSLRLLCEKGEGTPT